MQIGKVDVLKQMKGLSRGTRLEIAMVCGIALIAIFFRFYNLAEIPPGLNSDEATNFLHMAGLLRGEFRISFGPDAREPFFFYLSLVPVALLGFPFFAMRITAGIIGVVTILLLYAFARFLFRSRLHASVAAFLAAISVWHIFWSRYGLRAILSVLLVLLAMWWYWRAVRYLRRRDFALAGVCTGLGLYTYLSARMLPLALILITLVAILFYRNQMWQYIKGLMLTGTIAAAIFVPLALYYVTNVQDFISHSAKLSIFDPNVNKGDLPVALWNHFVAVIGMFLVRGDHEAYRNIPNRPVFDPIIGTFFVIGLIVLSVTLLSPRSIQHNRLRAAFIVLWFFVLIVPSILSDDPPSFVRTLGAMPATMMIAAWGVVSIMDRLRGYGWQRVAAMGLGLLLIAEVSFTYRDYFIEYAPSGVAFYAFDGHIVETGKYVNQNAQTSQIFIAPLWYVQPTFQFMTRSASVKSFESRDTVVLPGRSAGKDALVIFPQEQTKKAERYGERLTALGTREIVPGAFGIDYAIAYRVPATNLPEENDPLTALARGGDFLQPQQVERAAWHASFGLLGYSMEAADLAKRNLEVTLFLHALAPMSEDYTFSVKVRDERGRTWGQEDKWAGSNSYATTQWSPGDVIVEKFYPGLSACAPAGAYHVSVEAYNPKTMQVVGDVVTLGTVRTEASRGNLYEHLEPERTTEVQVASQARVFGYTLTPEQVGVSDAFSLALFWRGIDDGKQTHRAVVKLRDVSAREFVLADQVVTLPATGRGLCTFFDFDVPRDAASGEGTLWLNDFKLTAVQITR